MDELLELIGRIGSDEPPTSEELTAARGELVEALRVATAPETRDLQAAVALREGVDQINTELAARTAQAEADEAEARRLLEGLEEPEAEASDETETVSETETETEQPAERRVPVAAANRPDLRRALARTRARATTDGPSGPSAVSVATLGAARRETLTTTSTLDDVAGVFARSLTAVKGAEKHGFVHYEFDYPTNRRLTSGNRAENDAVLDGANVSIEAAASEAVVAAGGICAPLPADFTVEAFGSRQRPIRDALPQFQGAPRTGNGGGVRFTPALTLANLVGSTGVWTIETDENPGETLKECLVLECEEEQVAYVDAVTACLQIGNFQARFNQPFWRGMLRELGVAHDRLAEQTLYAQLRASASLATYTGGGGTLTSVLGAISKADAGIRSRLRLADSHRMNVIMPAWLRNALRDDVNVQRMGAGPNEMYGSGIGDDVIRRFFSSRNVNPIYSMDLDLFSAQATGTAGLQDYPGGNTELLIYPEGAYFFLDGGMLDLGTEIIDGDLVRQNNRMAFWETFEQGVFRGGEAIAVTVPVDEVCLCPSVEAA